MKRKHLSSIANDVIRRCSQKLNSNVDSLVEEFEREWKPEMGCYSKKLVEFCCSNALTVMCGTIDETISDGSFSRFTFDMMLAWETPSSAEEESYSECISKEKEEKKVPVVASQVQDDIPLFYSDIMPLLVDQDPSAGEDAFVWLGSLVPLVVDMVNGRFTYETLTTTTANRLHFPAYDKFLTEIHKCIKHLQKQDTPTGVELLDDEFILHVEGTASSQRVVRHIGGTSWPGRLTLTNYALYFEASGVLSYEEALKLDLRKDSEQNVKPVATGPWEFPEMTSSTRRDHWLALVKEIMLLHKFLSKFKVESSLEAWEIHARTILGTIRLHAAREMLRISPPEPKSFLMFALLDELPKGDYILLELAESLKKVTSGHPRSASSILRNLNVSQPSVGKELIGNKGEVVHPESFSSLKSAINQSREEAKEIDLAKSTVEGLKDEGISEKWVGLVISALLLSVVAKMLSVRRNRIQEKQDKIVIRTGSDQTTMESIVSAQQGLRTVHEIMQQTNIAILKIWSILVSKAPRHTNMVMAIMTCSAVILALIPFKFVLMGSILYGFTMTSKLGKYMQNEQGNRLKICIEQKRIYMSM
ncbi:hypothetical protein ACJIZ3_018953 [Penstemon smallii]|uniref:Uncharacterized protein n=1 Tax=Penstemon smallii TaxID=265156 RepID=A0ABD3SZS8_9LAMI